jgi:hypothetical protein
LAEEDEVAERRQCEEEEAAKAMHISILRGQFEAHHTELLNAKLSKDEICM